MLSIKSDKFPVRSLQERRPGCQGISLCTATDSTGNKNWQKVLLPFVGYSPLLGRTKALWCGVTHLWHAGKRFRRGSTLSFAYRLTYLTPTSSHFSRMLHRWNSKYFSFLRGAKTTVLKLLFWHRKLMQRHSPIFLTYNSAFRNAPQQHSIVVTFKKFSMASHILPLPSFS